MNQQLEQNYSNSNYGNQIKRPSNANSQDSSIQSVFFSKDTIAGLNKSLLQQSNYQNLSREGKQELINILVRNMKSVYKLIDVSKINNSNIKMIFEQFKNHAVSQSLSEIKKTGSLQNFMQTPSELKFQRDFNSNPTNGNMVMDRPEATKVFSAKTKLMDDQNTSNLNQKVQMIEQKRNEQRKLNDPFSGFSGDMNNYDSNLDQVFKPIVDNIAEQDLFNKYENTRSDDIGARMEKIQQMRQTEVNSKNNRPPTPDFLKSKKTNPDKDNNPYQTRQEPRLPTSNSIKARDDFANSIPIPQTRNGKPDFVNAKSSDFNKGFQGLSNDTNDGSLFSLDNIDKPLIDGEIEEDKSSFEDRLKKLQSDRGNITLPPKPSRIDFTSDNFPRDSNDNLINNNQDDSDEFKQQMMAQQQQQMMAQQQQQQMMAQQQQQMMAQQQQQQMMAQQQQQQMMAQQKQKLQQQMMVQQKQQQMMAQQKQQILAQQQMSPVQPQIRQSTEQNNLNQEIKTQNENKNVANSDRLNQIKNSMKSSNIEVKDDLYKFKLLIDKLRKENDELKQENQNLTQLRQEVNSFNNSNSEFEKINEIKKQIAEEFELLNKKTEEVDNRINEINLKELELKNKESEIVKLQSNYDYLFRTQYLQFEVSNGKNLSSYTWEVNPIKNVTGIKLMSYSIPQPRYNIEEGKNNIFIFYYNDSECKINIPAGKYSIEYLIETLDRRLKEFSNNIKIFLSIDQYVCLESDNESDNLSVQPNSLSSQVLGFVNKAQPHYKIKASRIWDLRMEDRVYLFLNNLSDDVPFGVLYFNGQSVSQFKFQKPYTIDKLDIVFKDSKGLPWNFYDLPHNLSFMIEMMN
jgi:hypothetical protein